MNKNREIYRYFKQIDRPIGLCSLWSWMGEPAEWSETRADPVTVTVTQVASCVSNSNTTGAGFDPLALRWCWEIWIK